jgi:hypothetical protein
VARKRTARHRLAITLARDHVVEPAHSKSYVEKMVADSGLDDETAYKVLRRNAIRMLEFDRV